MAPPRRPPPRASRAPRADARAPGATRAQEPRAGSPEAGLGRPPGSRHLSSSVPRSRAVRGALFLFRPLNVDPSARLHPSRPSPFLASPSLLFGPHRSPSQDSSYPFAASSSLHLCFSRHFLPEKLVPARGPPPVTVVPLPPSGRQRVRVPMQFPEARAPRPVPGVIPKPRPGQRFLPATPQGQEAGLGAFLPRSLLRGVQGRTQEGCGH